MTDDTLLRRIVVDPAIFSGKPIIRGLRISVELVLSLLAQGQSADDIREKALARLASSGRTPGRYRPHDTLLTFLEAL